MKKIIFLFCLIYLNTAYSQVDLIPFIQNGKWGYCGKDMKVIIPCKYDQAYPFFEERALVQIYDTIEPYVKSFFIDPKGNIIINLNSAAQGCPASRFQNGVAVVENYNIPIFGEGSNLCVIDKNGNLIHQIDSATMDMDLSMFREYSSAFNDDGGPSL